MSNASIQQARPTGNGEIVLDSVIEYLAAMYDRAQRGGTILSAASILDLQKALIERSKMGAEKYGTTLRVNNGRRVDIDLFQELCDAVMYARQAQLEDIYSVGASYFDLLVSLAARLGSNL